jgi:ABC-2 type transport system ATP-binding protein
MTTRAIEDGAPLAQLRDARKAYGKVQALDGIDLELRAGELLAVLGPNGAGKTTAPSRHAAASE